MPPEWSVAEAQEFVPQNFDPAHMVRFLPSLILQQSGYLLGSDLFVQCIAPSAFTANHG